MMFNGLDDIHPVPGSTLKIPIAPDSENDV
jgi:hypothetical protein